MPLFIKTSGAEIVVLHVLEHIRRMDPSAFLATSKEAGEGKILKN
jgi:hypothetical protein